MTINKNSTEQINVALLDLENKIKRNNQTAAISALENNISLINKTLNEKQNGLVPGETYDINISGNAATSNHSLTADNATTADSATTATTATNADNATNADHATSADYAATAGSAPIVFPEGFVYVQLNGKSNPAQMNMTVPDGCAWVDISEDYASFPYIKIGSGTTQSGRVLNHTHGMAHFHSHRHRHPSTSVTVNGSATAGVTSSTNNGIAGSGAMKWCHSGNFTWYPTWTVSASGSFTVPSNNTNTADNGTADSNYSSRYTSGSRTGSYGSDTARNITDSNNASNTTNEVNATYAIVWEVQQI